MVLILVLTSDNSNREFIAPLSLKLKTNSTKSCGVNVVNVDKT